MMLMWGWINDTDERLILALYDWDVNLVEVDRDREVANGM